MGQGMRVGILTFHNPPNYGAVLQVLGLEKKLQELGHAVTIIDFDSSDFNKPSQLSMSFKVKSLIKKCINPLRNRHGDNRAFMTQKREKIQQFRADWLLLSNKITFDQLPTVVDSFDAFVVGSDQVWNANWWGVPCPAYFLEFCKDKNVRKISYAPCFGEVSQPTPFLAKLDELIRNFDYVSVRSAFCRKIVEKYTHQRVPEVVDPTLLCSFGEVMSAEKPYNDYILLYSLSSKLANDFRQIAGYLKEKTGCAVVSISPMNIYAFADKYAVGVGPSEFLSLVKNAEFILTDSYHGVIFSMKFSKPFIAVSRNARSVRIADLLNRYGILDRLVGKAKKAVTKQLLRSEIDYDDIHRRMDADIEKSVEFLKGALGDASPER